MTTPQYDPSAGQPMPDTGQYGPNPGQYGQAPQPGYGQAPSGYGQTPQVNGGYGPSASDYGEAPDGTGPGFAMPRGPLHQPNNSLSSVVRKRGLRQVMIGAAIFIVGLLITVFTYHSASSSSSGGTYFVAWGPMIVGLIAVVRGLIAMARASKLN